MFSRTTQAALLPTKKQVSAATYQLSSTDFSSAAVEVVSQLQQSGYQAYIVGGGVRDLLLNKKPKDFDVATSAKPEEVKRLFRRCFLVGRRFRLAHVHLRNEVVEVATFRAEYAKDTKAHKKTAGGMITRDNIYGTLQEDALRRDFTINALYYDPTENTIIDYTGGLIDLEQKQLRVIGEAKQRYREDPVRILRAIRLANKLDLSIETETAAPLAKLAPLLSNIPAARLAEEIPKIFLNGQAWRCLQTLDHYHLFAQLFPTTSASFKVDKMFATFIELILADSDQRLAEHKTLNFSFLLAAFLWQPLQNQLDYYKQENTAPVVAFDKACRQVLQAQSQQVLITRKHGEVIREIWRLQRLLESRRPRYIEQILTQVEFRLAYDFLILREQAGEPLQRIVRWWTDFIAADAAQQATLLGSLTKLRRK